LISTQVGTNCCEQFGVAAAGRSWNRRNKLRYGIVEVQPWFPSMEMERAARLSMSATCVEIKFLPRVRAESSFRPPRHRRDACSMSWRCRFLAARPSQDGRVIAEK
jgi:hypothetical protein